MKMRYSNLFILFCFGSILLLYLALVHSQKTNQARQDVLAVSARLVANLGLTDLCLSTEARHTRHPSQADYNAAFQSHPLALEHFPSGSILGPPPVFRDGR